MKKILSIERAADAHWVGDGFPVRTIFSYQRDPSSISPFLLLDYAGPAEFPPSTRPRGVEQHPHRGFETVTIVYSGELEHRDSAGGGGRIGSGDVQWMTAGSGLLHEEFHGREFSRRGGMFEVVQLWVNLPAKFKMSPPKYQTLMRNDIPELTLPDGSGTVRVIAGQFQGRPGPARTFTPVELWDLRLANGAHAKLSVPEGFNTALLVLSGSVRINQKSIIDDAELALFDRAGAEFAIDARADSKALLLSGEPINEPVVGRGPFVMNTEEEIRQAMRDYQAGRMGRIAHDRD